MIGEPGISFHNQDFEGVMRAGALVANEFVSPASLTKSASSSGGIDGPGEYQDKRTSGETQRGPADFHGHTRSDQAGAGCLS